jgi:hypothetical protein
MGCIQPRGNVLHGRRAIDAVGCKATRTEASWPSEPCQSACVRRGHHGHARRSGTPTYGDEGG